MITFKEFINVELTELTVRDAAGHKIKIKKVPIRMADGTLKMQNPGKSGSSGGGDGGD